MKCPCIDCLVIAACKSKSFHECVKCKMIYSFIYLEDMPGLFISSNSSERDNKIHKKRVLEFQSVLKPTNWKLGRQDTHGGLKIIDK
jgi:hypothetical protein